MERMVYLDYVRSLSMMYVVGFWHLFNYTDAFPLYMNFATQKFTLIVLGTFIFVSGYLIGATSKSKFTLKEFFIKRFIRIYPLYALSLLIFYAVGLLDFYTVWKSIVFVSLFDGSSPLTLWFITVLFTYYLLAPIYIESSKNVFSYIILFSLILCTILILSVFFPSIDGRFLQYYACFFVALYIGKEIPQFIDKKSTLVALLLFFPAVAISFVNVKYRIIDTLIAMVMVLIGAFVIVGLAKRFNARLIDSKFISVLAYSSFCMYLLHRPIFLLLKEFYFPATPIYQTLYLYIVCLPIIGVASYYSQLVYDSFISRIIEKLAGSPGR